MTETVTCEEHARVFAALADPVRVRFLRELAGGGERSGSEIANRIDVSLALLCHHAKILVDAGVVFKRKPAQTAYYTANKQLLRRVMKELLASD